MFFESIFGRCPDRIKMRKIYVKAQRQRKAASCRPFTTMHTCGLCSFRQHRSTTAAGTHNGNSTPGGRWASHRCGGASNVDAPGLNLKLYGEHAYSLIIEGAMQKYPRTLFALAGRPGSKGPRTSGLLLWFACWLFSGDATVLPRLLWVL